MPAAVGVGARNDDKKAGAHSPLLTERLSRATAPPSAHPTWRCARHLNAAGGGAGRRSAKNAAAPMNQSREAHHSAWPLHSPEGG